MTTVYFKPHIKRNAERTFFNHLISHYKEINHIRENYQLPESLIQNLLSVPDIIKRIEFSKSINKKKKEISLAYLGTLPKYVKVASTIADLSIDIVIKDNGKLTYIEFHEKQHKQLSGYYLTPIFSEAGERYEIPRFLQRLIKDVWRWDNLENYKIVWHNWFDINCHTPIIFTNYQNEEFALDGKFKISLL